MSSTHSEACRPPWRNDRHAREPRHVHRGGGVLSPPLVVDGIGCLPVNPNGAKLFFRLINAWYGSIPTVLTYGEGSEHRGEILHDEVMASVLLDRLLYRSHIVDIRRNSYRVRRHSELPTAIRPTAPRTGDAEPAGTERNREERRGTAGSVHCSMATDVAHMVHSSRMSPAGRPDPCARHPRAVTQQYDRNGRDPGRRHPETPRRRHSGTGRERPAPEGPEGARKAPCAMPLAPPRTTRYSTPAIHLRRPVRRQ